MKEDLDNRELSRTLQLGNVIIRRQNLELGMYNHHNPKNCHDIITTGC